MYTAQTFLKFHYTDAAGLLFFSNIFLIAHDVYEEMLTNIGFPIRDIIEKEDFLLPLVHAEADYKLPLRAGDKITVKAVVSRLGTTSYTLFYKIVNDFNQVAAAVQTVHVAIDKKSGKTTPIPKELKAGLERFREIS